MKGNMLIISANGITRLVETNEAPTLDFLKLGLNNGMLEVVPLFTSIEHEGKRIKNCVAFCDEEGKIKNLPYNETATEKWQAALTEQGRSLFDMKMTTVDFLVGPVIVVWGDKEFMEAL